jgi:hypothetical protein
MTTNRSKTPAQWRQLLALRAGFDGSNAQFCRQHNISESSYYKQRQLLAELEPKDETSAPRFVQVTPIPINSSPAQHRLTFDPNTGLFSLCGHLTPAEIVMIFRGLMA